MFRKAVISDIDSVGKIYEALHDEEEKGVISTGWIRGVYPTRSTAAEAFERGDLFVCEENGVILGAGIINQIQVDVYAAAPWKYSAEDDQVCVLHTLVISPSDSGRGLGTEFVRFYESYARDHRCPVLRIDTNARNTAARAMYRRLGYTETAIVPTVFNGIPGVNLVLLEKRLEHT